MRAVGELTFFITKVQSNRRPPLDRCNTREKGFDSEPFQHCFHFIHRTKD